MEFAYLKATRSALTFSLSLLSVTQRSKLDQHTHLELLLLCKGLLANFETGIALPELSYLVLVDAVALIVAELLKLGLYTYRYTCLYTCLHT